MKEKQIADLEVSHKESMKRFGDADQTIPKVPKDVKKDEYTPEIEAAIKETLAVNKGSSREEVIQFLKEQSIIKQVNTQRSTKTS